MKTTREKVLVAFMVLVLLVAGYLTFSGGGSTSSGAALLSTADARKKYDDGKVQYLALGKQDDFMQGKIAKWTTNESPGAIAPAMVTKLMSIAKQSGVHLDSIRPLRSQLSENGAVLRVPVQVDFKAPFHPNVIQFLYRVEDPKGKLVVDHLDVHSGDTHFATINISARISTFTTDVPNKGDNQNGTQTGS